MGRNRSFEKERNVFFRKSSRREKSCGKGGERLALSDFEAPQGMWKDPGIFPRTFLKDHFPQGSFSFPRKMWRNLVTAWS
ncbi:hypothetical protein HMPREF1545_04110 [Oscillibacter sp. KLE 1728]|nr:hypothetical protein HMPREF1545_04110 [Oscillibacter sp. KLE 1728]ERK59056.1 hypothetical protein HMPREF1546_03525 [Oscillibacter sp. KLE 1745]